METNDKKTTNAVKQSVLIELQIIEKKKVKYFS